MDILSIFENEFGHVEKEGKYYYVYDGGTLVCKLEFYGSMTYIYNAEGRHAGLLTGDSGTFDVKYNDAFGCGGYVGSITIFRDEVSATELSSGRSVTPGYLIRQVLE